MLIPNQFVKVKMSGKVIPYYRELGYEVKDVKTELIVPVEHLTKGSHVEIDLLCDCCNTTFKREYKNYLQCTEKGIDYCESCGKTIKAKQTIKKKYGVDNVMDIPNVKDKIKQTCLERYGVDNYSKTNEFKEKVEETCVKRYGVKSFLSSPEARKQINRTVKEKYGVNYIGELKEIHDKAKQTNLKKYGTVCPSQSEEIKEKIKRTCLERYGVENLFFSEDIKQKIKSTNLDRYGVENPFQSEIIKEKITNTNMNKYGVPYVMQNKEIKEKVKQSMLQRYGYEYVLQVPELKKKMLDTMKKNGTNISTSSQQIEIFKILKRKYHYVEINYPVNFFSLDVFVFVEDIKIDVEYDGWYWHQDKQRDIKRDKVLQKEGYKVLRIKSGRLLPTEEQLFEAINKLVETDRKYTEIVLDDWKEGE